jgi:hypothetical protein
VLQNRFLRRIFGPKNEEVTETWVELHYEELHNLYSSPKDIRVIILRIMTSVGHVARIEKR